jgi:phthiocerol/phenolphthiocerol synthesis type-I polyketide synthase E
VFRRELDTCADIALRYLQRDIRQLLFSELEAEGRADEILGQAEFAQPAIFSVSYAAAKLWRAGVFVHRE